MSNKLEHYKALTEKLQNEELRSDALNDLKNFLVFEVTVDAVSIIRNGGMSKILNCLELSDKYVIFNSLISFFTSMIFDFPFYEYSDGVPKTNQLLIFLGHDCLHILKSHFVVQLILMLLCCLCIKGYKLS